MGAVMPVAYFTLSTKGQLGTAPSGATAEASFAPRRPKRDE